MSLGPTWTIFDGHPWGDIVAEAKGTIKVNKSIPLMLLARFPLTDNPEILNELPVDAFDCIRIDNLPAGDKMLGPLSRLTGLRRLDFREGEFHDKAFGQLRNLVNLEGLTVTECFVTGESMTHFGTLKKLKYLHLKNLALDWKLLGKSGPPMPAVEDLFLEKTNLTDEGLAWIERMPNLSKLLLDNNAEVTDKGLKHLVGLKKLRLLTLRNMKVTAKGLLQLKNMNDNRNIILENSHFSASDISRLKSAMPHTNFEFSRSHLGADDYALFAPLP